MNILDEGSSLNKAGTSPILQTFKKEKDCAHFPCL